VSLIPILEQGSKRQFYQYIIITGRDEAKVDETEIQTKKSWRGLLTICLVLIVALPLILLSLKEHESISKLVKPGVPAPDFTFPDLEGKKVSLSEYRGWVVLVNIWATWCPPCVEEAPSIEKLYNTLKGDQFKILAVSIDSKGREAVVPFMKKYSLTFPVLLDPEGKIRILYGLTGVPESFVIDRKGIVVEKVTGPIDWAAPAVVRFFQGLISKPSS
jgi:cytochrome c biogenesis protein CcmG/thiol:disulfide interchange protein DsbE